MKALIHDHIKNARNLDINVVQASFVLQHTESTSCDQIQSSAIHQAVALYHAHRVLCCLFPKGKLEIDSYTRKTDNGSQETLENDAAVSIMWLYNVPRNITLY